MEGGRKTFYHLLMCGFRFILVDAREIELLLIFKLNFKVQRFKEKSSFINAYTYEPEFNFEIQN